jgi:hypothetical protein
VELPSLDAELGAKDQLLVHHLRAVLGCHPVVGAIIGDVEDLLPEGEVAPHFRRAIESVPKAGFGRRSQRVSASRSGFSSTLFSTPQNAKSQ